MYWFILFVGLLGAEHARAQTVSDWTKLKSVNQAMDRAFDLAVKKLNLDQQTKLQILYKTLDSISEEDLYFLKAAPDSCATPDILQCDGLVGAIVKPFIDMALDKRKAKDAAEEAQRTYNLSWWAFVVAAISLITSIAVTARAWKSDSSRQAA
jgi:hypothetical protein